MSLTTTRKMLLDARQGGWAVGAFNAENMEMVQAIVAAAEELQAPVMIQTTPSTIRYGGLSFYYANVAAAAAGAHVPVALHLDHGDSFALAMQALREGYTSIMIDGSHQSFEDNIALTRSVVAACDPSEIPVEAELGYVGGKEDDLVAAGSGYTDPDEAIKFVERSGAFSLAVGIGTAHGIYSGIPVLDVERLSVIRSKVSVPLVLHGGSGLSDEAVRDTIRRGICKVNFATELRIAYTDAVKKTILAKPDLIDPKVIGKAGRAAVQALVKQKILVCGSAGKA